MTALNLRDRALGFFGFAEVIEQPAHCSGPRVALLFQKLLAGTFLIAWLSLGSQVQVLIGSDGLLPIADLAPLLQKRGLGFSEFPSLFLDNHSDAFISAGIWFGLILSASSFWPLLARPAFALNTFLYLGYCVACQDFLAFQWDNLLLECGLLAVLLPTDKRAPWIHFLLRVLLFKVYVESGIAKYQSHLGDWQDGTAMTLYYETAPIPTLLAWFAHHLPEGWHNIESVMTLVWEILVPFLIFGPRRLKLTALVVFSAFQLINILTANYGFFSYLALVLSVFLLSDTDIDRAVAWLSRRRSFNRLAQWLGKLSLPWKLPPLPNTLGPWPRRLGGSAAVLATVLYVSLSYNDAVRRFSREGPALELVEPLRETLSPLRVINSYHLFGHITRKRIEPEFQVLTDAGWQPLAMHYKPGPLDRAPPFVAPHQPRVDFRLWFYGLSQQHGVPRYVVNLLKRLCHEPEAVQGLFETPLPDSPHFSRVVFWQYHYTDWDELSATGNWWKRESVSKPRTLGCKRGDR